MSEEELTDELNELKLLRASIFRIDPTHALTKPLGLPFFPPIAYKGIALPHQCRLAEAGFLKTSRSSVIDGVLEATLEDRTRRYMSEAYWRDQLSVRIARIPKQKRIPRRDSSK